MTKEKFINSGRFVDAKKFSILRPTEKLNRLCMDVVLYDDGQYIQALNTGEYLYDSFMSSKLDDVENYMWKKMSEN
jgi:hypothetical protein